MITIREFPEIYGPEFDVSDADLAPEPTVDDLPDDLATWAGPEFDAFDCSVCGSENHATDEHELLAVESASERPTCVFCNSPATWTGTIDPVLGMADGDSYCDWHRRLSIFGTERIGS